MIVHSFKLEMIISPAWICWIGMDHQPLPHQSVEIPVLSSSFSYLIWANLPLLTVSPHPSFFSLFQSFHIFPSPLRLFLPCLLCVHIFFFFPSLPLCWFVIGRGVLCGNVCHPDLSMDIPYAVGSSLWSLGSGCAPPGPSAPGRLHRSISWAGTVHHVCVTAPPLQKTPGVVHFFSLVQYSGLPAQTRTHSIVTQSSLKHIML